MIRVLTYNVQSGLGVDSVRDIRRAGQLVADNQADLAGLQEVEVGSPRTRFENQPVKLAEASGMHKVFAHGFQRGPWRFGNAVLSKYPIKSAERHELPSAGEQRSLLASVIDPGSLAGQGICIHLLCTHLGLNRDERVDQVKEICRLVRNLDGPVVLLGDFNDFPDSPPIQELLSGTDLVDVTTADATFQAPEPTAKIDFIFARGLAPTGPSRVIRSMVSDHLPVVVDLELTDRVYDLNTHRD